MVKKFLGDYNNAVFIFIAINVVTAVAFGITLFQNSFEENISFLLMLFILYLASIAHITICNMYFKAHKPYDNREI